VQLRLLDGHAGHARSGEQAPQLVLDGDDQRGHTRRGERVGDRLGAQEGRIGELMLLAVGAQKGVARDPVPGRRHPVTIETLFGFVKLGICERASTIAPPCVSSAMRGISERPNASSR